MHSRGGGVGGGLCSPRLQLVSRLPPCMFILYFVPEKSFSSNVVELDGSAIFFVKTRWGVFGGMGKR